MNRVHTFKYPLVDSITIWPIRINFFFQLFFFLQVYYTLSCSTVFYVHFNEDSYYNEKNSITAYEENSTSLLIPYHLLSRKFTLWIVWHTRQRCNAKLYIISLKLKCIIIFLARESLSKIHRDKWFKRHKISRKFIILAAVISTRTRVLNCSWFSKYNEYEKKKNKR